jgi:peptidoglycan/xylan/chitin deacetylase (PgdA/CDA1 family)
VPCFVGGTPLERSRGVPALPLILCYHKVERRRELGVTRLSPRRFAHQMERLARDGWRALTLDELLACACGERSVGSREVAITFDDAYRGLRDHAFPVLEALGFPAVCFAITDYAGRLNRWDVAYGGRRFAHLAWRDMRRWQGRGITFASHTATHPRLTWLEEREAALELALSRRALCSALGECTPVVSYPFGAVGEREAALATAEGYEAGFALSGRWSGDRMSITRLPVYPWSPRVPGVGLLGVVEHAAAAVANRCAVGTTVWQRLTARRSTTRPAREPLSVAGD